MKLLPFVNRTYTSPFSADYLLKQLEKDVSKSGKLRSILPGIHETAFHGVLHENTFELQRSIFYRNAFNPAIEGRITDTENGAVITVSMRPAGPGILFLIFSMTGLSFMTISLIFSQFQKGRFDPASLLILLFWGICFGMVSVGFFFEVRRIDDYFSALCKAEN